LMKIFCRLNLVKVNEEREHSGFAKVTFGGECALFVGKMCPNYAQIF